MENTDQNGEEDAQPERFEDSAGLWHRRCVYGGRLCNYCNAQGHDPAGGKEAGAWCREAGCQDHRQDSGTGVHPHGHFYGCLDSLHHLRKQRQ